MFTSLARALGLVCLLLVFGLAHEFREIHVAGAANLTKALQALQKAFLKHHPDAKVRLSFGSSGKLYNQIHQARPLISS